MCFQRGASVPDSDDRIPPTIISVTTDVLSSPTLSLSSPSSTGGVGSEEEEEEEEEEEGAAHRVQFFRFKLWSQHATFSCEDSRWAAK